MIDRLCERPKPTAGGGDWEKRNFRRSCLILSPSSSTRWQRADRDRPRGRGTAWACTRTSRLRGRLPGIPCRLVYPARNVEEAAALGDHRSLRSLSPLDAHRQLARSDAPARAHEPRLGVMIAQLCRAAPWHSHSPLNVVTTIGGRRIDVLRMGSSACGLF
jgi:hypothetical protein